MLGTPARAAPLFNEKKTPSSAARKAPAARRAANEKMDTVGIGVGLQTDNGPSSGRVVLRESGTVAVHQLAGSRRPVDKTADARHLRPRGDDRH